MSLPQGTLSDAKRISSSLSRAQNLLEASLSQAETATGALDRDGNTIKEILNEHAYELKGGLSHTKKKLKTLRYVEIWEKYSIYGSLCFFCLVVSYITLKRTRVALFFIMWVISIFGGVSDSAAPVIQPVSTIPKNPTPDAYERFGNSLKSSDDTSNSQDHLENFDEMIDARTNDMWMDQTRYEDIGDREVSDHRCVEVVQSTPESSNMIEDVSSLKRPYDTPSEL